MIITSDNYFSDLANWEYMGSTQYKNFLQCEEMAMAILKGIYILEKNCFLEGKYIHSWNEGKMNEFIINHPILYSTKGATKGELKAIYKHLNKMIEKISKDNMFMAALSGKKEVIFTAEMFGCKWKILIDSYFPNKKRFGDLKALKDMKNIWNNELKTYENIFESYGYFLQLAIYAEIERLANKREDHFEPFLAVVTKEKTPDMEIISFNSDIEHHSVFIARELIQVERNMPRILRIKSGDEEPIRCGTCEYCKETKVLTRTKHYTEFNVY